MSTSAAIVTATAAADAISWPATTTTAKAGFDHFAKGPLHAPCNARLRGARLGLHQLSRLGCSTAFADFGRAPAAAAIIIAKPCDDGIGTTACY